MFGFAKGGKAKHDAKVSMQFLGNQGQIAYFEDAASKAKAEINKMFPKGGVTFDIRPNSGPEAGFQIRVNGVIVFDKLVLSMGFLTAKSPQKHFDVIKQAILDAQEGNKPTGLTKEYEEAVQKKEEEEQQKKAEEAQKKKQEEQDAAKKKREEEEEGALKKKRDEAAAAAKRAEAAKKKKAEAEAKAKAQAKAKAHAKAKASETPAVEPKQEVQEKENHSNYDMKKRRSSSKEPRPSSKERRASSKEPNEGKEGEEEQAAAKAAEDDPAAKATDHAAQAKDEASAAAPLTDGNQAVTQDKETKAQDAYVASVAEEEKKLDEKPSVAEEEKKLDEKGALKDSAGSFERLVSGDTEATETPMKEQEKARTQPTSDHLPDAGDAADDKGRDKGKPETVASVVMINSGTVGTPAEAEPATLLDKLLFGLCCCKSSGNSVEAPAGDTLAAAAPVDGDGIGKTAFVLDK
eukprot:TRINITY_DN1033_c0_g1_i1.p1 TRINITY_DN1033_c0_g1~~TRINITY_DN1033_c0_g1_i1.p1  ORF type:complete len:463 (+),score=170.55 TRINITY_DN1033_c0_g1_i1:67-1455(+)